MQNETYFNALRTFFICVFKRSKFKNLSGIELLTTRLYLLNIMISYFILNFQNYNMHFIYSLQLLVELRGLYRISLCIMHRLFDMLPFLLLN